MDITRYRLEIAATSEDTLTAVMDAFNDTFEVEEESQITDRDGLTAKAASADQDAHMGHEMTALLNELIALHGEFAYKAWEEPHHEYVGTLFMHVPDAGNTATHCDIYGTALYDAKSIATALAEADPITAVRKATDQDLHDAWTTYVTHARNAR